MPRQPGSPSGPSDPANDTTALLPLPAAAASPLLNRSLEEESGALMQRGDLFDMRSTDWPGLRHIPSVNWPLSLSCRTFSRQPASSADESALIIRPSGQRRYAGGGEAEGGPRPGVPALANLQRGWQAGRQQGRAQVGGGSQPPGQCLPAPNGAERDQANGQAWPGNGERPTHPISGRPPGRWACSRLG